jgi:hypothetical protein
MAGGGGNEDEDLNSDDDDDDDAEVERTTEHIILCRYDKVARQKQKWKSQVPIHSSFCMQPSIMQFK